MFVFCKGYAKKDVTSAGVLVGREGLLGDEVSDCLGG